MDYQVKHIGQHRGNARLWFEARSLNDVGLCRGARYDIVQNAKTGGFDIVVNPLGERVVSGKEKNGVTIPIIDINSSLILGELANEPAVKVIFNAKRQRLQVMKLSSAEMQHARKNRLAKGLASVILTAALCFGGGIMDHAAHAGMLDAGVRSELAAVVDIDADLLEHAQQRNPVITARTQIYNAPMQELVQDRETMAELPTVDILITGIPCSGASISGKSKLRLATAEDHPQVGHLVVPYLMLVNQFQPSIAVVECVVPYAQTVSAKLMRTMLRDMGYVTQEVVLNAYDFGSIEDRRRWFLVAATQGIEIDLSALTPVATSRPTLGQFLTDVPDERYNSMPGLRAKEVRDRAAGKGFMMQLVNKDSTRIGTIGKDYMKNRSTEPKVQHADDPSLLRLLTPAEHAAIKGLPLALIDGLSATSAHQLLGQGVDTRPVRALFRRIGEGLLAWRNDTSTASTMNYSLARATG